MVNVLVLFGTVLSGIVCYPLQTQGQMSAVCTIVSAGYGFICGAYMPISNSSMPEKNYAYSARTAHPFQRNGAPFRFKLSKAQQVD